MIRLLDSNYRNYIIEDVFKGKLKIPKEIKINQQVLIDNFIIMGMMKKILFRLLGQIGLSLFS